MRKKSKVLGGNSNYSMKETGDCRYVLDFAMKFSLSRPFNLLKKKLKSFCRFGSTFFPNYIKYIKEIYFLESFPIDVGSKLLRINFWSRFTIRKLFWCWKIPFVIDRKSLFIWIDWWIEMFFLFGLGWDVERNCFAEMDIMIAKFR